MKKLIIFFFVIVILLIVFKTDLAKPTFKATLDKQTIEDYLTTKKAEYDEAPIDAYIDRVWKKTTGRNGLSLNVEKSMKAIEKARKLDDSLLVIEEVPPKVKLADLPAAPIYRGHPDKEMVTLLINVSWGEEYLPTILKILKEEKVKATFFIEGKWAKENKTIVKMIADEKHLIGSHAYNHPDMKRISNAEIVHQIVETNNIIEAIIGERPKYFAPPSGSFDERVIRHVDDEKMETILWTVDTIDWKNPTVSVMINRVMTKLHPGALILMHPTLPVAEGLKQLITEIKQENYQIDRLDILLDEKR